MLNIKKKKIKDKGIALCHEAQGFSANKRPVSLLMKSDLKAEDLSEEVIKNLQQVTVTMSMEEFLSKFFGLWQTDAELLTKLLGFETELENKMSQGEMEDDPWEKMWSEAHQDWLENEMQNFSILKAGVLGEDLSLSDKYQIILIQQTFEKAVKDNGIIIEIEESKTPAETNKSVEEVKPEPQVLKVEPFVAPEAVDKGSKAIVTQDTTKSQQENNVTDVVDVTKSAEYIDMQTKLAALEKAAQEKDDLIKAAQAVIEEKEKQEFLTKASSIAFVSEEDKPAVADILMKAKEVGSLDSIMMIVEKASAKIAELEKSVADKDAELVAVKKEFGEVEHGTEQKPTVVADRQQFIDQQAALLKAAKQKETN